MIHSVFVVLSVAIICQVHSAELTSPREIGPDATGITTVNLVVKAARVTVDGAVAFNSRLYHLDGVPYFPGPTIRVAPGGTLKMTVQNLLDPESDLTQNARMNQLRHVNHTNIHTHGLHVDPNEDSIFRLAPPGSSLSYNLKIPAGHAPGTHWYHSHAHGAAVIHMMGGLHGALLVSDPTPTHDLSAYPETVCVLQHLRFTPQNTQNCGNDKPLFDPFKVYSMDEMNVEGNSLLPA
eukprot:PhF_6_TR36322/c2_g2_i3/m.53149